MTELKIWDKALPPDGYVAVADFLDATKCSSLVLGKCELSNKKLSLLGQNCEEKGCKVLIFRFKSFFDIFSRLQAFGFSVFTASYRKATTLKNFSSPQNPVRKYRNTTLCYIRHGM